MTLRTRLTVGLALFAAVLLLPLAVTIRSLDRLHDQTRGLRDAEFAASLILGRLRENATDFRSAETNMLVLRDEASADAFRRIVEELGARADSLAVDLHEAVTDIRAAADQLEQAAPPLIAAARAGRLAAADSLSENVITDALRRMERGIAIAERRLRQRTRDRVDAAAATSADARRTAALALLLGLGVAAATALWLTRSISDPVTRLQRGMEAIAQGDFDRRLGIRRGRRDEFGQLASGYEDMAARLKALDRLKAEFISVASHELKTPINVIIGYLQLLDEGVYGELTSQQKEVGRTLDAQARTLDRLVKQLLDVSRFEAGGARIDPRPLELRPFLQELERTFHVLAVQRGVEFDVSASDDLPAEVHWDRDRMNEVLGNLLSNAFKFTDRSGRVSLEADTSDNGSVLMKVCDTGAGIPPEQLPRIFEKFYQADNQGAASHLGSGLGLAIAREIVRAHRGDISVDSTVGRGTTFAIVIPARVSRRASTPHGVPFIT
jgi:signal transduction histidine kinase